MGYIQTQVPHVCCTARRCHACQSIQQGDATHIAPWQGGGGNRCGQAMWVRARVGGLPAPTTATTCTHIEAKPNHSGGQHSTTPHIAIYNAHNAHISHARTKLILRHRNSHNIDVCPLAQQQLGSLLTAPADSYVQRSATRRTCRQSQGGEWCARVSSNAQGKPHLEEMHACDLDLA